jgi:hypothetical protein
MAGAFRLTGERAHLIDPCIDTPRLGAVAEVTTMEPNAGQYSAPKSKLGPKSHAQDDLKSLPLPEVEKKLGSSPNGLTQAEACPWPVI